MSERKISNSLYMHLHGQISRARQLEYTIRATRKGSETQLAQLIEIDAKMLQRWTEIGASSEEVHQERLMDMTWDLAQTGQFLHRRHGRIYSRDLQDLITRGLETIPGDFVELIRASHIPAVRTYRICDLLNGNDIRRLLSKVAHALTVVRRYSPDDEIELRDLVLGVRTPILIHPAFRFADWSEERDGRTIEYFGFAFDTQADVALPEVMRQVREFLYQFALHKQARSGKNAISDALIQNCLEEELATHADEVPNLDVTEFLSTLSGLYCWDRVQSYKKDGKRSFLASAINDTLNIYPKPNGTADDVISDSAVKKTYYTAEKAIRSTFQRLYPTHEYDLSSAIVA